MDNVFAVLFRTPPDDDTGKPHILEHLATCGSKMYPVRDPFFAMMKRSLNTYMNAWTGADFTMYPFSTCNVQDYRNLLTVYCDMAFNPTLKLEDFQQEGHRLEFAQWDDANSKLGFHGVVLNEMKGAMSSPEEAFIQDINRHLFKSSQYRFNSGGDPATITDLAYEDLKKYHADYYHPSNAWFLSYGDLDFTGHLDYIGSHVISGHDLSKESRNSELMLEKKSGSREADT